MKAYIYRTTDNVITNIITNVITYYTDINGKYIIKGDTTQKLGKLYDFIALEDDTLSSTIGDTVDISSLTDLRAELLKSDLEKLQDTVASLKTINANLQTTSSTYDNVLDSLISDIIPTLMSLVSE